MLKGQGDQQVTPPWPPVWPGTGGVICVRISLHAIALQWSAERSIFPRNCVDRLVSQSEVSPLIPHNVNLTAGGWEKADFFLITNLFQDKLVDLKVWSLAPQPPEWLIRIVSRPHCLSSKSECEGGGSQGDLSYPEIHSIYLEVWRQLRKTLGIFCP